MSDDYDINDADNKDEVVMDANIYALLVDMINKNEDDIEQQQYSLKEVAKAMYAPTLSRRLFRVLFPSVEASRRVR